MTFFGKMLAGAVALGTLGVVAPAMAQQPPAAIKVSPKAQPALLALQTAVNANDTAKFPGAIAAAQAVVQTKEDRFTLGQLQVKAGLATKDDAMVAAGTDLMINSGLASADTVRVLRLNQAQTRLKAKDYAGAQTQLQALIAADPKDTDAMLLLSDAYAGSGNGAQALSSFQKAIAVKQASGQPVPAAWRKQAVALAYNNKLPGVTPLVMEWVKADPRPETVRDAARIVGDSANLADADQIDLFRLQRAAGALKGESEYYRYSSTALLKGFPGEAKAVLDQGFTSGAINKSRPVFSNVYSSASSKVAADKAALGTTERSGLGAATARQALVAGDVFLGYGDYAKAAGLYRAALTKSGADANLINLRLGEALAGSGDKAGALAQFAKVGGTQQSTAQLWAAWVSSH